MPLPPGLLLNPATGELTGIPTVAGTFAINLEVRDALGNKRQLTDDVTINPYTRMSWTGDLGNLMATRVATGVTVALHDGLPAYTYQVYSGALPAGMSLNPTTGAITGTPTDAGGYAVTIRATDSLTQTADYLLAGTVVDNLTLAYSGSLAGTATRAFTTAATTAGGTTPYAYAVQSGALPAGLTLNPTTGAISGTPSAASSASVTIRVTDAHGFTADTPITFDIAAMPALSGALARTMVGRSYSQAFSASGGHTPYSYTATNLVDGLSIDPATGAISGSPTNSNSALVTVVTLTDALGVSVSRSQAIQIADVLTISGSYASNIPRTSVFSFTPSRAGGWAPYTFAISAGALPTGLSLNTSTGVISGTATAQGSYTATLRVTDGDAQTATMAVNITVAGDLSITGTPANFGTTTVAYSDSSLGHSGGQSPYAFSISSGALPAGLTLNTGTGAITGTPTTPGTYNFTVKVSDANASFASTALTITVAAFPALSGSLPDATNGVAYSASYTASGGHAPLAYDISVGSLPNNLTINSSTGVISGTPDTNGASTFTVRATDAHGNVATRAGTVTVYAAPALSGSYTTAMEATVAYSSNAVTVSGGKAPIAWTVSGGTLPPGLTLNGTNGLLSGTPTTAGSYTFTVRATDALGRTASSTFTRTVAARLTVSIAGVDTQLEELIDIAHGTITVAGGVAPFLYFTGNEMPFGTLGIADSAVGTISGHANSGQHGTYHAAINVQDALGVLVSVPWTYTVKEPVSIAGTPKNGTVGVPYSYTFTGTFGWPPYAFTWSAGTMPNGLSINNATGVLSGTPTVANTFNPTIHIIDNLGGGDSVATSIVIHAYPTLTLNYTRGTVGQAYSAGVTGALGWPPYTYAYTGQGISGLLFSTANGAITGTPTVAGTYTATTTLTDSAGNRVTRSTTITIAGALQVSGSFVSGKVGTAYSDAVQGSGGWPAYSFAKISGTLPTGLSLASNGTLSGTPSAAGNFTFTVRVTDADGNIADKAFTVSITASSPLNVSVTKVPAFGVVDIQTAGGAVTCNASATASATGGTGTGYTYAWTLVSRNIYQGQGGFIASGTTSSVLRLTHTGGAPYDVEETWRVTCHDSGGATDTFDVTFEFIISHDASSGA
jgi:uncharacterized protein (DUF433 family)